MTLSSVSKQALTSTGHRLYLVQLRYNTRILGKNEPHFVTRRDILYSELSSMEDDFMEELSRYENLGHLYSWTISITPQLDYKPLAKTFISLESKLATDFDKRMLGNKS